MSFALLKLSDNWKPFNPGFNYIIKIDSKINKNISLLHYCGTGGYELAFKDYQEYFNLND